MLSIFGPVRFKPGLFLSGENLIRYVVTPENPRKLVGDFPVSLKYYGRGDVPPISVAQGFGVFRHCNDLDGQLLCILRGRQPAQ